jgi:hypothetical protein
VILITAFATAQNQSVPEQKNSLAGKAVVFESNAAYLSRTPRQNVRVETLAGRQFFVWENKEDGKEAHDYWTPADMVTKIRVFGRIEEAKAFCERRATER